MPLTKKICASRSTFDLAFNWMDFLTDVDHRVGASVCSHRHEGERFVPAVHRLHPVNQPLQTKLKVRAAIIFDQRTSVLQLFPISKKMQRYGGEQLDACTH